MKKFLGIAAGLCLAAFLLLAGFLLALETAERKSEKSRRDLSGMQFSVLGDSLSAYEGYIPEGNRPYYNNSFFDVSSMWWQVLADQTGMLPCVIDASGGSGVTELLGAEEESAGNGPRCERLGKNGQDPDLILVWLGGNDYRNGCDVRWLQINYEEMLRRMQATYRETEIYVCTYFSVSAMKEAQAVELNTVIRQAADAVGVPVIDTSACGISEENEESYIIDLDGLGIHPNQQGQELVGNYIAEKLLEGKN